MSTYIPFPFFYRNHGKAKKDLGWGYNVSLTSPPFNIQYCCYLEFTRIMFQTLQNVQNARRIDLCSTILFLRSYYCWTLFIKLQRLVTVIAQVNSVFLYKLLNTNQCFFFSKLVFTIINHMLVFFVKNLYIFESLLLIFYI